MAGWKGYPSAFIQGRRSAVERADDAGRSVIDDIGVDHRGPHVFVARRSARAEGAIPMPAGVPLQHRRVGPLAVHHHAHAVQTGRRW
jgi:hypothetical protein